MAFGYNYEKKFGGAVAANILTIFQIIGLRPEGAKDVYKAIKDAGFGYRKQNVLEDYRHYRVVGKSKTPEAREKAEKWYQVIYKPMFEELKSAKKVTAELNRIRKGSTDTSEQAEANRDYIERYLTVF